jgi:hypothetical protein
VLQVSKLCQDILEKRKAELELDPLDVSSRFQKISDGPSNPGKGSGLCKIDPLITLTTSNRRLGIEMSTFLLLRNILGSFGEAKDVIKVTHVFIGFCICLSICRKPILKCSLKD